MPNYLNGKIYIIRSPNTEEVYIGSTTQSLAKRMGEHKQLRKQRGTTSIKIFEAGNAYIELVEEYPCQNKEQLNKREGEIMRQTENCVNKCIAGRTIKEYRVDNKEVLSEKAKEWREINKDLINQNNKKYRENNIEKIKAYKSKLFVCECGEEITISHKSRHLKSKKHTDKLFILKD